MEFLGEIYCITSPSGKKYVGQCMKHLSNGRKHGYSGRWKEHIRDANYKNNCRLLNASIRKYKPENFTLEMKIPQAILIKYIHSKSPHLY
jgi:hypothetical protein